MWASTKISGPVSNFVLIYYFSDKGNLAISWAKRGFPFPSLSISESSHGGTGVAHWPPHLPEPMPADAFPTPPLPACAYGEGGYPEAFGRAGHGVRRAPAALHGGTASSRWPPPRFRCQRPRTPDAFPTLLLPASSTHARLPGLT